MIATDNPEFLVSVARIYRPGQQSQAVTLPHDDGDGQVLAPGPVSPATRAVLPVVLDMCRRIVPWATVILSPRVLTRADAGADHDILRLYEIDGTTYREWGGLAARDGGTVWLALSNGMSRFATTAAHECWHCLEKSLSPEWVERIDTDLSGSFYAEGLEYWGTPSERRARAFETFAGRMLEGLPPRLATTLHKDGIGIDEIFAMAWTGQIADEIARLDALAVGEVA